MPRCSSRDAARVAGSSDPNELRNNMQAFVEATFEGLMVKRANSLGERAPFNVAALSTEQLQRYVDSPVTDRPGMQPLRGLMQGELQRRAAAATPPGQQTSVTPGTVVTAPNAAVGPDGVPVRTVQTTEVQPPATATAPATAPAQTARSPAQIMLDDRAQDRQRQNAANAWVEESHNIARQNAELNVRRYQLQMDAAREAKDDKAYRRAREARQDAEKRGEKIASLFAQIGRLVAGSGSGGGGGSISGASGGDQDVAAFRITPSPQRSFPTPGAAISGRALPAQGPIGGELASAEIPLPRQRSTSKRRKRRA